MFGKSNEGFGGPYGQPEPAPWQEEPYVRVPKPKSIKELEVEIAHLSIRLENLESALRNYVPSEGFRALVEAEDADYQARDAVRDIQQEGSKP